MSVGFKSLAIAMVAACFMYGQVPVSGPNVNMVSGTNWPNGDPFLQRQNEPSLAVSSRNPLHLVAGSNDYRTVDFSAVTNRVIGDSWLGLYKSFDGGQTWRSTLMPGCPYDIPACRVTLGGPFGGFRTTLLPSNFGLNYAGADPVIRSGPNGMFYYGGIAFSRSERPPSIVFVSRFIDDNNVENQAADPIRYLHTSILNLDEGSEFLDKPWLTVDIPRPWSQTCRIPAGPNNKPRAQTFPGGPLYVAYAAISDADPTVSRILFQRSWDCGNSWTLPQQLSTGNRSLQGATLAVDPRNGALYVAWRQLARGTDPHAIVVVRSTDGGRTFTVPATVATFLPFDMPKSTTGMRTTAFPSMAVDATGRVYLTWTQRGAPNADARIVLSTSADGVTWSTPQMVDPVPAVADATYTSPIVINPGRGHQIMPALKIVGPHVSIAYYDLREDSTVGELRCPSPAFCTNTGQFVEYRKAAGNFLPFPPSPAPAQLATVFAPGLNDATPAGAVPLARRHTLDVRVAMASAGAAPVFQSGRVSSYFYGSPSTTAGLVKPIQQLRQNVPNLPLFINGTTPFMGDYIDQAAVDFQPGAAPGTWVHSNPTSPTFHVAWTDNRDVRPPANGNWANYTPPVPTVVGPTAPACIPGQAGMRDQNIYTARVNRGLLAGSPGNSKQLSPTLVRAFVVLVQNGINEIRSYRLTIANQPAGGRASFVNSGMVTTLDVTLAARSSASRTVFATSSNPRERIDVNVAQVSAPGGAPIAGGLTSVVQLNPDLSNPDLTNPDLTNPDLTNAELYNPDLTNPDLTNPDLTNPDLTNPDLTNPDLTNPDLTNPDLTNPDLTNLGLANPDLTNPDLTNPDLTNPDLTNATIASGNIVDATWRITNRGNTTASYNIRSLLRNVLPSGFKVQLILHKTYTNPIVIGCSVKQQISNVLVANIANPQFVYPTSAAAPDLTNPDLTNATISLAPGETGKITLRVVDPDRTSGPQLCGTPTQPCTPGNPVQFNPGQALQPAAVPQPLNTGATVPVAALIIATLSLPDGQLGAPYSQVVLASGGTGARSWSIAAGTLPPGLTLSPTTGQVTGTPLTAGTFLFTLRVTDTGSPVQDDTQEMSIRIGSAPPLASTTATVPTASAGTPYSFTPTVTGGTGVRTFTFYGALPPGLTANPADGMISGTATTPGTYAGYFVVQDSSSPPQYIQIPISIAVSSTVALFVSQPTGGTSGQALAGVVVRVQNSSGTGIAGVPVTLTAEPNPGGGTVGGTTTVPTGPTGNAAFSNVQITRGGYGYRLIASAGANGTAVSNSFPVAGFSPATNLLSARRSHTATSLGNGDVLLVGGYIRPGGVDVPLGTAELYRATPSSTIASATGSMLSPRGWHTATLLGDGRVLIAGGDAASAGPSALSSVEVYNPATGTFSPTGAMGTARRFHTATRLPDGRVLVTGGRNLSDLSLTSAEIYNPATGSFLPTAGSMAVARDQHTAVLLPTGKVLIAGGRSNAVVNNTAELFDPLTGTFAPAGTMTVARAFHTATLLNDSRVLLTGGNNGAVATNTAELYDSATGVFSGTGSMAVARDTHAAMLMPNGKVLIAGGPLAEVFNPSTGIFTASDSVPMTSRTLVTLAMLPTGTVVATGGVSGVSYVNTVEQYSPTGPPFQSAVALSTGSKSTSRFFAATTHLADGRVFVSGGYTLAVSPLASTELYNPTTETFTPGPVLPTTLEKHTSTLLRNGKVLVAGGVEPGGYVMPAKLFDPVANTITTITSINCGRYEHAATLLANGRVLLTGGISACDGTDATRTAEIYDPVGGTFTYTGPMSVSRFRHQATLLPNGKVLITGGDRNGGGIFQLATAELYDPDTGIFSPLPSMANPRTDHAAILLRTGKVLLAGGGQAAGVGNATAELFDYQTNTFSAPIPAPVARAFVKAELLPNGKAVIMGAGYSGFGNYVDIFDPATQTVTLGPTMTADPLYSGISRLPDGRVLLVGSQATSSVFLPGQ